MSDFTIISTIQKLAGVSNEDKVKLIQCTVNSVDIDKRIAVVSTISGTSQIEFEAQLTAGVCDGLVLKPKVDSMVYVLTSKYTLPFIVQYSDVDAYTINGDEYGGIVKVIELTQKLNALEQKVNDLITACASQVVTLAPAGTFPLAPFFTSVNPLTPTNQTEIENKTIKHGK